MGEMSPLFGRGLEESWSGWHQNEVHKQKFIMTGKGVAMKIRRIQHAGMFSTLIMLWTPRVQIYRWYNIFKYYFDITVTKS